MSHKYLIRLAGHDDTADIAKLSVQCWHEAYADIMSPDFLAGLNWQERALARERFYENDNRVASFVAYHEDKLIGFADCGPAHRVKELPLINQTYGEIYALYVLQSWQRQAIGMKLCQAACEYLLANRFKHCVIWTLLQNTQAHAFYQDVGASLQAWRKSIQIAAHQYVEQAFTIDLV